MWSFWSPAVDDQYFKTKNKVKFDLHFAQNIV